MQRHKVCRRFDCAGSQIELHCCSAIENAAGFRLVPLNMHHWFPAQETPANLVKLLICALHCCVYGVKPVLLRCQLGLKECEAYFELQRFLDLVKTVDCNNRTACGIPGPGRPIRMGIVHKLLGVHPNVLAVLAGLIPLIAVNGHNVS